MTTVLPDAVGAKAPATVSGPALPAPASTADMALLAAQLQTLAEEMGRLRMGLDRLLVISDARNRQGPDPAGLGPLNSARELDASGAVGAATGFCAASSAGGAEEARGRVLWVQERLLLEAQALLGEMVSGSQPPGAAGVFTDARLRKGPVHAKKARAAAAAAAAAATTTAATGANGDRMELAGRPRHDNSRANDGGLEQREESASHHDHPAASQAAVVGCDNLHCSRSGSGRDTPAKVVGGVTMPEVVDWDSSAAQMSPGRNYEGRSRGRDGVDAGASDGEGGFSRNRVGNIDGNFSVCNSSQACGPSPMIVPSRPSGVAPQQHDTPIPFLDRVPSWLGVLPAQHPAGGVPMIIAASQAGRAFQAPPSAQRWSDAASGPFVQTQGGSGVRGSGPLQDLLPSLPAGEAPALGVGSAAAATRYCI